MNKTPNLDLTYLVEAQAQKHVTVNQAIRSLDALVQLNVVERGLLTPPTTPVNGTSYLIGTAATEDWVNQDQNVASYQDGAWEFHTPKNGWIAWVLSEGILCVFNGSAWTDLPNAMFAAQPAGYLQRLSRTSDNDDAAINYQTGFQTHALAGLLGDTNYTVKVSPDGILFTDAIVVENTTGTVTFPQNPSFQVYCNYKQYIAANNWVKIDTNVENYDRSNDYDIGTKRLNIPVDGQYHFEGIVKLSSDGTPPTIIYLTLFKNGVQELFTQTEYSPATTSSNNTISLSNTLDLVAGDYVELFTFFATNDSDLTAALSVFSGFRVS
ncbi:MAG: DUF2793 domain-containing protein [Robiginitomaculum sp.]|nr:DUF2793 domain-containing protein [Robiginitomaculum sp.]